MGKFLIHIGLRDNAIMLITIELIQWTIVIGSREIVILTACLSNSCLIHLCLEINHIASLGIMHALEVRLGADKPVGIHIHAHSVFLTLLCGDHNHTIGSQSTIDTTCCGIFQHRHRLYIVRVDLVECHACGDVVDDDERLSTHIIREGTHTTQDRSAFARVRVDVEAQTCHLSFQRAEQVFMNLLGKFLAVDKSERTRGIGAFDGLITCYHHVIKHSLIIFHDKGHRIA